MNDTARQEAVNGEPYDFCKDFTTLTPEERRAVMETAEGLLKQQRENALPAGIPIPPVETENSTRQRRAGLSKGFTALVGTPVPAGR